MVRGRAGFSLVEVVIAVGVFALGVAAIFGLLPGMLRELEASDATLTALRLPDAVEGELRRLAAGDPSSLRARLANEGASTDGALRLVADRSGADVRELSSGDGREMFFLVELLRFPDGRPFDDMTAALGVRVRVSWPFRVAGVETAMSGRETVEFNVVLNR